MRTESVGCVPGEERRGRATEYKAVVPRVVAHKTKAGAELFGIGQFLLVTVWNGLVLRHHRSLPHVKRSLW